jgi:hypothetical protein
MCDVATQLLDANEVLHLHSLVALSYLIYLHDKGWGSILLKVCDILLRLRLWEPELCT